MSVFDFMFVPMILFMVIVAPIWIVLHYRSVSHSSRSLNEDERESLEEMLVTVDRLTERIRTLESLLDAEHAGWRKDESAARAGQAEEEH